MRQLSFQIEEFRVTLPLTWVRGCQHQGLRAKMWPRNGPRAKMWPRNGPRSNVAEEGMARKVTDFSSQVTTIVTVVTIEQVTI